MTDKALLLLLILFLMAGVFTFDRHMTEKKGISPIGKMIDYGGLASLFQGDDEVKEVTKVSIKENYHYNARTALLRMRELHLELAEKRRLLVEHRIETLDKLVGVSKDIGKESRAYLSIIEAERKNFMKRFPELENVLKEFSDISKIEDVEEKKDKFEDVKTKIKALYVVQGDGENDVIENVDFIIARMETMIFEESLDDLSCKNVDVCLSSEKQKLTTLLKDNLNDTVYTDKRNLDDVHQSSKNMENEISFLKGNWESTEIALEENMEEIESSMKGFIEDLIRITDEDVVSVMDIYRKLIQEHEALYTNMELHDGRIKNFYQKFSQQMVSAIENLKLSKNMDSSINSLKHHGLDLEKNINEHISNQSAIKRLFLKKQHDQQMFLDDLADAYRVDVKRLTENRQTIMAMEEMKEDQKSEFQKYTEIQKQRLKNNRFEKIKKQQYKLKQKDAVKEQRYKLKQNNAIKNISPNINHKDALRINNNNARFNKQNLNSQRNNFDNKRRSQDIKQKMRDLKLQNKMKMDAMQMMIK